jgi:hypothetical protein
MKYLRKIFEKEEHIDSIKEEKQYLSDIFLDIKDIGFDFEINYSISISKEFNEDRFMQLKYFEPNDIIYGCGYTIEIENYLKKIQIDSTYFQKYAELINSMSQTSNRLNSYMDIELYFNISEYTYLINILKKEPNKEDYYYIFSDIIKYNSIYQYQFNRYVLYKENKDYYLEFNLLEDEPLEIKQIKILKDFCSDRFEAITYDRFDKIDNLNFRLKNPKIKSINF